MKQKFFNIAKKMSLYSDHPDHKIGAVIVKKNRILSLGFNKVKTHSKSNSFHRHIHAELYAILNAQQQDLSKCSIYVYRETKNGSIANSKPCKFCQKLLQQVNIKTIYYSHEEGFKSENLL